MQQAQDFWDIHQQLYALVADLPDDQWPRESQFKGWTITDIIRHLHFWDDAVLLALQEPEKFAELRKKMIIFMGKGASLPAFEASILGDLSPAILREKWHDCAVSLKNGFADADPKARIPWVGLIWAHARPFRHGLWKIGRMVRRFTTCWERRATMAMRFIIS